jgi:protein-disulfide isomerase-like protein with CxxC motif
VPISATLFSDPGCPWAYSANPALTLLRWRYGDQLQWRLVTVGLSEDAARYVERGYTPARMAVGYRNFRRYGMPFATEPRARVPATGRACRSIVATRLIDPARELEVYRALQFAWFTTPLVPDQDEDIGQALQRVPGLDVAAVVAAIDSDEVQSAYAADKALARTAQGSPTEMQGKAATSDGPVRYTAPSLVLERDSLRLEAGGFQPAEAYDVLVANLDPTLSREPPPEDPYPVLERFPAGLVTQEVAAVMAHNNQQPDRAAAEDALIALAGDGRARRVALGDDALWLSEPSA